MYKRSLALIAWMGTLLMLPIIGSNCLDGYIVDVAYTSC